MSDLDRLVALRDRLELVLSGPGVSDRDLAAVSREYRMVLADIAKLAPSAQASPRDEIAARRAKRGAS